MSRPLYLLAAAKTLTPYQTMDSATLTWIKDGFDSDSTFTAPIMQDDHFIDSLEAVLGTVIDASPVISGVFFRANAKDSLHGILHAYRVALFAGLLASERGGSVHDAVIAGLFHDVARRNDQSDPAHGRRSSKVFRNTVQTHHEKFTDGNVDTIAEAIALHDDHDTADAPLLARILITADALDRYRLPKRKWWPDQSRMPIVPSEIYFLAAQRIMYYSELRRLDGDSYEQSMRYSVAQTMKELGA